MKITKTTHTLASKLFSIACNVASAEFYRNLEASK